MPRARPAPFTAPSQIKDPGYLGGAGQTSARELGTKDAATVKYHSRFFPLGGGAVVLRAQRNPSRRPSPMALKFPLVTRSTIHDRVCWGPLQTRKDTMTRNEAYIRMLPDPRQRARNQIFQIPTKSKILLAILCRTETHEE